MPFPAYSPRKSFRLCFDIYCAQIRPAASVRSSRSVHPLTSGNSWRSNVDTNTEERKKGKPTNNIQHGHGWSRISEFARVRERSSTKPIVNQLIIYSFSIFIAPSLPCSPGHPAAVRPTHTLVRLLGRTRSQMHTSWRGTLPLPSPFIFVTNLCECSIGVWLRFVASFFLLSAGNLFLYFLLFWAVFLPFWASLFWKVRPVAHHSPGLAFVLFCFRAE